MIEIKVNRKAKELEIYLNGEKVETLKGKEAYEWLKNANRIYTYNGDIFGAAYIKKELGGKLIPSSSISF